jgi:hypothetical protein
MTLDSGRLPWSGRNEELGEACPICASRPSDTELRLPWSGHLLSSSIAVT